MTKRGENREPAPIPPDCARKCKPDCETITYETHFSSTPLDFDLICGDEVKNSGAAVKKPSFDRLDKTRGAQFLWRMTQLKGNQSLELNLTHYYYYNNYAGHYHEWNQRECRSRAKDEFAVVKIEYRSPYAAVIKQDVRVSWSDKFGVIGGTVGLFTGLSIISVVETIYWVMIGILSLLREYSQQRRNEKDLKEMEADDEAREIEPINA